MKTYSMSFSKLLGPVIFGVLVSAGIFYSSNLNAAQGCGYGYHMTINGRCVPNNPGPGAVAVPGRPDCWINYKGQFRCWR
ncbi:Uncharacterised protein [Legionella lansingensis]|uniref:Uncharacterized protein n=1 Tax=Legionella lansingensis TaxID=45067 RepID=A0A0W0VYY7_9GAMM|nr:hypothetical protein [Legionella lansingensis]KTD25392.1 hypothetical protein Llan_0138 [Legionella lansingensis]SNV51340.1 Uncharacterised protein [Legionella lansingensis]